MEPLIAILAGGRGSRVGGGKATLELAGRPLISYPVSAALGTGHRVAVLAKPNTPLPELGVPIVREPAEPVHPLRGIVTGLLEAGGGAVVAAACDLPFVTAELLGWLAALEEPLVVPELAGRAHPLLSRYGPDLLEPLEHALEREQPMQETVRALGPRLIGEPELRRFGDPDQLLFNVNSREDLTRAQALLRR